MKSIDESLAVLAAPSTPETRIVVQQRTTEIKALMKRAASDIIEIGQKLIEVKAKLEHGQFGGWLESEFTWTPQLARQFINVADRFGSLENETLFRFGSSALRLLAAPSTPESAREEAIDRAEHGEAITHAAQVAEAIAAFDASAEDLESDAEAAAAAKARYVDVAAWRAGETLPARDEYNVGSTC